MAASSLLAAVEVANHARARVASRVPATGVQRDEISCEPLVLAVAAGHPLARRTRANLQSFSSERWIADRDGAAATRSPKRPAPRPA
jgi:DNA-binding transcriptional LysR family regulator